MWWGNLLSIYISVALSLHLNVKLKGCGSGECKRNEFHNIRLTLLLTEKNIICCVTQHWTEMRRAQTNIFFSYFHIFYSLPYMRIYFETLNVNLTGIFAYRQILNFLHHCVRAFLWPHTKTHIFHLSHNQRIIIFDNANITKKIRSQSTHPPKKNAVGVFHFIRKSVYKCDFSQQISSFFRLKKKKQTPM